MAMIKRIYLSDLCSLFHAQALRNWETSALSSSKWSTMSVPLTPPTTIFDLQEFGLAKNMDHNMQNEAGRQLLHITSGSGRECYDYSLKFHIFPLVETAAQLASERTCRKLWLHTNDNTSKGSNKIIVLIYQSRELIDKQNLHYTVIR